MTIKSAHDENNSFCPASVGSVQISIDAADEGSHVFQRTFGVYLIFLPTYRSVSTSCIPLAPDRGLKQDVRRSSKAADAMVPYAMVVRARRYIRQSTGDSLIAEPGETLMGKERRRSRLQLWRFVEGQ